MIGCLIQMPRRRRTYGKADIKLVWDLLEAQGKEPLYVKHCADGGFRVVCRAYLEAKGKSEPSDEPALAGWDDVVPHGQA